MSTSAPPSTIQIGGIAFPIHRPHSFGLVIDRPCDVEASDWSEDYLHAILFAPENRETMFSLIETEGLVVCRNVRSEAASYRKVRGKSSVSKLSQAEYYHHDGCSSPTKPRFVEIRCPHQAIARNIATAIAPLPAVIRSMVAALPETLASDDEMARYRTAFAGPANAYPSSEEWDTIQGKITRLVRRVLDAEGCREYFRQVDAAADAYVLPWQMGESRLMLNSHSDLTRTMQHRRAYQKSRTNPEQNGSLVKRWPAEELDRCAVCEDEDES